MNRVQQNKRKRLGRSRICWNSTLRSLALHANMKYSCMQAHRDEEGAAEQTQEAQRINRALEQHVQELEAAQQEQAKNAAVSAEDADGSHFQSRCHACLLPL